MPFALGLIGWGFMRWGFFFLFLDGFWLAGFVVWKEKQEGGASETQRPEEADDRTGRECGTEDEWNPEWGRQSGAKQKSAVMEGWKCIGGYLTCWTMLKSRTLPLPAYLGFTKSVRAQVIVTNPAFATSRSQSLVLGHLTGPYSC